MFELLLCMQLLFDPWRNFARRAPSINFHFVNQGLRTILSLRALKGVFHKVKMFGLRQYCCGIAEHPTPVFLHLIKRQFSVFNNFSSEKKIRVKWQKLWNWSGSSWQQWCKILSSSFSLKGYIIKLFSVISVVLVFFSKYCRPDPSMSNVKVSLNWFRFRAHFLFRMVGIGLIAFAVFWWLFRRSVSVA